MEARGEAAPARGERGATTSENDVYDQGGRRPPARRRGKLYSTKENESAVTDTEPRGYEGHSYTCRRQLRPVARRPEQETEKETSVTAMDSASEAGSESAFSAEMRNTTVD